MLCSKCKGELHHSGTFCTMCGREEKVEKQHAKINDIHNELERNMGKHASSPLMWFHVFFAYISAFAIAFPVAFFPLGLFDYLFGFFEIGIIVGVLLAFLIVIPFLASTLGLAFVKETYKKWNKNSLFISAAGGFYTASLDFLRFTSRTDLYFRIMLTILFVLSIIGASAFLLFSIFGYSLVSLLGGDAGFGEIIACFLIMVLFIVLIGFGISIYKNRRGYLASMVDALKLKHDKPVQKAPALGSILMGAFWVVIGLVLIPYLPVLNDIIGDFADIISVASFIILGIYYILSGIWMKCFDKDMRAGITAYRHENKVLEEITEETKRNIEEYERSIIFSMARANTSINNQTEESPEQDASADVTDRSDVDHDTPDKESDTETNI